MLFFLALYFSFSFYLQTKNGTHKNTGMLHIGADDFDRGGDM
jgi:hypothetical protein